MNKLKLVPLIIVIIILFFTIGIYSYLNYIDPSNLTVLKINNKEISIDYFIRRTLTSGKSTISMLQQLTKEEIIKSFGVHQKIISCFANAGDLIIADTVGYHRGEKPISSERKMLALTFCVHPEYGFDYPK